MKNLHFFSIQWPHLHNLDLTKEGHHNGMSTKISRILLQAGHGMDQTKTLCHLIWQNERVAEKKQVTLDRRFFF